MMFQFCMYFLSFTPLWACVLLQDIFNICVNKVENDWMERLTILLLIIVFPIAIAVMKRKLSIKDKQDSQIYTIEKCKDEKLLTAEFLFTFILPQVMFDLTMWQDVCKFLIIFGAFFFLCKRHNYFCANIMLELLHYHIYDCKLKNVDHEIVEIKVISTNELVAKIGTDIEARGLNNDYLFDCSNAS